MNKQFKQLQKENILIYLEIDTIISLSKMSQKLRDELLTQILLLIDNEIKQEKECNIKMQKQIKLYYHKTDGGAKYLCSEKIKGTEEGSFNSKYIIRIDGDIKKDTELSINED
jgi:hypothetical protein